MNHTIVNHDSFHIIGISLKTSFDSDSQDIPPFWGKFFSENILDTIPNKANEKIIATYTDYNDGSYVLTIGAQVNSLENIPEGLVFKTIPAAKFAVFKNQGPAEKIVPKMWQHIWNLNLERTFSGDFEAYDNDSTVAIYVTVK